MTEFRNLNDKDRFRFQDENTIFYVLLIHNGYIYYAKLGGDTRLKKPYAMPGKVIRMDNQEYYYKHQGKDFRVTIPDPADLDELFIQLNSMNVTYLSPDEYVSGGKTEDYEIMSLDRSRPIGVISQPISTLGL